MQALTFDSLAYAQELEQGGLSREVAETIARANARTFQAMLDARDLATKEDLKVEIAKLDKDLRIEIAELKSSLIKWMCGIMLAGLAVGLGGLSILVAIIFNMRIFS